MIGIGALKKAFGKAEITFHSCHDTFTNWTITTLGKETISEVPMPMEDTYQMLVQRLKDDGHIS